MHDLVRVGRVAGAHAGERAELQFTAEHRLVELQRRLGVVTEADVGTKR